MRSSHEKKKRGVSTLSIFQQNRKIKTVKIIAFTRRGKSDLSENQQQYSRRGKQNIGESITHENTSVDKVSQHICCPFLRMAFLFYSVERKCLFYGVMTPIQQYSFFSPPTKHYLVFFVLTKHSEGLGSFHKKNFCILLSRIIYILCHLFFSAKSPPQK